MKTNRLLIISAPAGSGHVRAAEALYRTAILGYPEADVEHMNMTAHIRMPMRAALKSYDLIIRELPSLWGFLYKKSDNQAMTNALRRSSKFINRLNARQFYQYIAAYQPTAILCTHFLPAQMLIEAPAAYRFPPISIVMTDYDKHMLLIHKKMHKYFVATEKMKYALAAHGIAPASVIVTGIPVDPAFYQEKNRETLLKAHGIRAQSPVILVLSGGGGLTRIDTVVRTLFFLHRPATILAVAGNNAHLLKKLQKLSAPAHMRYIPIAWTDAMDEYMRMADIVISKPGGITTTECMTLGKPLIAIKPIPGQEEHNAEFIVERGYGRIAHTPEDLLYYTEAILDGREPIAIQQKIPGAKTPGELILDHVLTAEDQRA